MPTDYYTGLIKVKGWKVGDVIKYWGRTRDWYYRNTNGTEKQKIRLECMCKGLPDKND